MGGGGEITPLLKPSGVESDVFFFYMPMCAAVQADLGRDPDPGSERRVQYSRAFVFGEGGDQGGSAVILRVGPLSF